MQGTRKARNQKNLAKVCHLSPLLTPSWKWVTAVAMKTTISIDHDKKWPRAETAFFRCFCLTTKGLSRSTFLEGVDLHHTFFLRDCTLMGVD